MGNEATVKSICALMADILEYPKPDLLDRIRKCIGLVSSVDPKVAALLEESCSFAKGMSRGRMEEIYTSTFDLQVVCYPYAGYHLFGESHKRGAFMVKLKEHYRAHGFSTGNELPDHITLILRFLAIISDKDLTRVLIDECLIPSLRKMREGFKENSNPYGKVIEGLLLVLEGSGPFQKES